MPNQSLIASAGDKVDSLREHWPAAVAISALVLVPCFWHRHIEAGDLASHVYNAWLVQLSHHGTAPGLWIAYQNTNVLFDWMLSAFAYIFGLALAEKFSVAIAVLIFFWGSCAFVFAASRRFPWFLLPVIATLTYGWTFHAGFFNYFLSIGLSSWALAFFWQRRGIRRVVAPIALAPLIALANPLGLVWLFGAAAYIAIAETLPRRWHPALLLAAAALVLSTDAFIRHNSRFYDLTRNRFLLLGANQLILFGWRYELLALATLVFGVMCLATDALRRKHEPEYWPRFEIPLHLCVIVELAVLFLPSTIYFGEYSAPLAFLIQRLTSISAILLCAMLALIRPRKWHAIGFAIAAAVFFSFLYQDTATLNRMENQVQQMVSQLPPGSRVLATVSWSGAAFTPPIINHIVDRACINRCFAYGNYEPASLQFRVRARAGNGIVMTSSDDVSAAERGVYVVQPSDLPLYQVYQCSADFTVLCIRPLQGGDINGDLAAPASQ
jgi:hypothetical protein